MEYSQKYCLVQFIEPLDIGSQFSASEWPLHTTLAGVFALDIPTKIKEEFQHTTSQHACFTLVTEGDTYFGESKDIHVRLLRRTPEIVELHNDLVAFIGRSGGSFNEPHYLGDGFTPHISIPDGFSVQSGEDITIQELSLVDMFPDSDYQQRKVIARFPLRKL